MDSISYQAERLRQSLCKLDLRHALPHEEAQQLLLSLANATAIVRRAVEWQRHNHEKERVGSLGSGELGGTKEQITQLDHRGAEPLPKEDTVAAERLSSALAPERDVEDPISRWKHETIRSIAICNNVPVEELRSCNPKLSAFGDDEVLPTNTYIRMRTSPNRRHVLEEEGASPVCQRGGEAFFVMDDAGATECPLPLAPLPSMQGEGSRSVMAAGPSESHDESNSRNEVGGRGIATTRGSMMLLPSPSPVRHSVSCRDRSNGADSDERVENQLRGSACRTPIPVNSRSSHVTDTFRRSDSYMHVGRSPASPGVVTRESVSGGDAAGAHVKSSCPDSSMAVNGLSSIAVPSSLLSKVRASIPPLAKFPATTDFADGIGESKGRNYLSPLDIPKSAGNVAVLQKELVARASAFSERLRSAGHCNTDGDKNVEVAQGCKEKVVFGATDECEGADDEKTSSFAAEKSDYITSSRDPSVGGCDYDTIYSIATQYKITVCQVLEWNPHLNRYGFDDPLPPNLPLVLPMPAE